MRRVLVFGMVALSACKARAEATSFNKWLENPFPPAAGFSLPFGDDGGATRVGESYGTGVQTGEDWNTRGGDTGHGQPVMAIATGKVVVARRFDNPWGRVVMLEHIASEWDGGSGAHLSFGWSSCTPRTSRLSSKTCRSAPWSSSSDYPPSSTVLPTKAFAKLGIHSAKK